MYKELLDLLMEMEDSPAREKLAAILSKNRGDIYIPFVQIPPFLQPPYKITTTGDDTTKYVTYTANGEVIYNSVGTTE